MSQTESGNLSEVLGRIEALKQRHASHVTERQSEVPRLTEAFDGDQSLQFIAVDSEQLSALVEGSVALSDEPVALPELTPDREVMSTQQREALIKLMKPEIRAAVKKAVTSELAALEKSLKTALEQDMLDILNKRIESGEY